MQMIIQRAIVPMLLLAAGVASLVYGFGYDAKTVIDEQQVEEKITIPSPYGPPPGFPGGLPGGETPPLFQPPPMVEIVKRIVRTAKQEPESRLVFEVSIGGVTLLDTGELKRTYAGKAPSLCPS